MFLATTRSLTEAAVPAPPFRPLPSDAPELIRALDRVAHAYPLERKVVVAGARGAGRELLRTLARMRGGWTGFVVETPRPFALRLATTRLASGGLRVMDEFEEEALVDEAVDVALAAGGPAGAYEPLAGGPGFRKAVRGALSALRLAGVTPADVEQARFQDPAKRDLLARALEAVVTGMDHRRALDVAGVLALATEALEAGEPLPGDRIYLLPGLSARGAAGRFVAALRARGAEVLPTEPVVGREPPARLVWREGDAAEPRSFLAAPERAARGSPPASSMEGLPLFDQAAIGLGTVLADTETAISLFHAAGIHEELREVLRRVLSSGRRFDEVEIVTPDPAAYGPALHSLAARSGVGVTFAVGLPVARTRPGRAVVAYLRWISDDFPSEVLRRLLEAGDLAAPGAYRRIGSRSLARRLRRLRIGWGRGRYGALIQAALRRLEEQPPEPQRHESPEDLAHRTERERRELEALRALLRPLLRRTPREVPKRLDLHPRPVAPAALAGGLAAFLRLVPTAEGSVDETARERLLRILDRIRSTLTRPVPFGAAVGVIQDHLDIRVPAPRAEGKAPWLSDGGSLHLSDLGHGGLTGRPVTFMVGMDAGRFPGGDLQDPLLLDRERAALSPELPTSAERLEDERFAFAALFARLRGEVTLSYPAWEASEARVLTPSPELLRAFRLGNGQHDAGFDRLRRHLGTPVSRIPSGDAAADREDVWLRALLRGDHFLEGTDAVRSAFPRLDAGLAARRAWVDGAPGPHHGLLAGRPTFDPRKSSETVLSASRLEALGACPLRYFYRYVLRVSPPDDPTYEPEAWLTPLHRGSLLHSVYERLLRLAREEGVAPDDTRFESLGHAIVDVAAERLTAEVPPPSVAVYARELEALRNDVDRFAEHLRRHPAPWEQLELSFGPSTGHPVHLDIAGGTIRLRGAVDRVDSGSADPGAMRIVDYKTGGAGSHWARATGVYHGGRRLQHLLYTLAMETLENRTVEAMEYHFPTQKGEGEIRRFERGALSGGDAVLGWLLDAAGAGRFLPTENPDDCRFCDYQAACRVIESDWGGRTSPPAHWAKAQMDAGAEEYRELREVRGSG